MEAPRLLLLLSLLYSISFLSTSVADDGAAMLALAKSFNPPPSDWSTTASTYFCEWTGVRCTSGRVTSINLADKSLSGVIAPQISALSELKYVSLQRNRLTGKIPSLAKLSSLQEIYMDDNSFIGVETLAFAGLTSLQILSLSDNSNFSAWRFPSELADSSSLTSINLDSTNMFGVLPNIFQSLASLQNLRLSYNRITGPLPPSLVSLGSLKSIYLNDNRFQGPLPLFPPKIKVNLDYNEFCTTKAGQICSPQVMALLSVAGGLGYPLLLAESWHGDDACSGWAYVNCDSTGKSVVTLNLGKLGFSGFISLAIANLTSLKRIYLNDNNLSGLIPKELASMTSLQLIDVSNNNLSGDIPNFPASVKLIYKPGNSLIGTYAGDSSTLGTGGSCTTALVIACSVLAFLLVIFIVISVLLWLKSPRETGRKNHEEAGHANSDLNALKNDNLDSSKYSLDIELIHNATKGFTTTELGRGGFGVVYAGKLEDGTLVAVKKMHPPTTGVCDDFSNEIKVLTRVRHRNLVSLLGYCEHMNDKYLIYEYMPQGDLGHHLFKWSELGYTPLTWEQRVYIALDVARGLHYLHDLAGAKGGCIHRDLKPANILLGDDMRAKIADFGLASNLPLGMTSKVTEHQGGTFGYKPEEYACWRKLTKKVDVYAFGVILLELLTGRQSLDNTYEENRRNLVTWFTAIQINKLNIAKALDPNLATADKKTLKDVHMVAALAVQCTDLDYLKRPMMSEVVHVLAGLSKEAKDESTASSPRLSYPKVLRKWINSKLSPGVHSYSSHSSSFTPPA